MTRSFNDTLRDYRVKIPIICLMAAIALYQLFQIDSLRYAALDGFDHRPEISVLFIGNSRTFYNDMPMMVRKIADSAHSKNKYHIVMYALPGKSLQDQWNDSHVHDLLKRKWSYVVLQGGSSEQINDTMEESFNTYGVQLATLVTQSGSKPVLFVAWRCLPEYYPELRDVPPNVFYWRIQRSYAKVAKETGAAQVNVGKVWEELLSGSTLQLFVDGNHPNVSGSYLTALMFYRFFSGDDLKHVAYLPDGIKPKDGEMLRMAAQYW